MSGPLKKLRSEALVSSALRRQALPAIGDLPVLELGKGDVARTVDKVEATAGPVAADRARTYLASALRWHAERDDQFHIDKAVTKVKPRTTTIWPTSYSGSRRYLNVRPGTGAIAPAGL